MAITLRLSKEEEEMIAFIKEKQNINTKSKTLSFCLKKAYELLKDLKVK